MQPALHVTTLISLYTVTLAESLKADYFPRVYSFYIYAWQGKIT